MHFFHNKIVNASSAPDPQAWDRWVDNFLKSASEAKPGTGIEGDGEKDPRNQGKGQVINTEGEKDMTNDPQMPKEQGGNARPDKGGDTEKSDNKQTDKEGAASKPVVEAKCGKEMGESSDAGKVTEKHTPAGPGNDENPDPKILINNDPNYQKGESTNPGKVDGKNKKGPGDKVVGSGKKAASKPEFKKIASLDRQEKVALIGQLGTNNKYPISYIEAIAGLKVANLTAEEKEALRAFWRTMYDEEYVTQMLADR